MDIAVSPRATFYASPMKILEYMAMGIATVAPDMVNIHDIIVNGENGYSSKLRVSHLWKSVGVTIA